MRVNHWLCKLKKVLGLTSSHSSLRRRQGNVPTDQYADVLEQRVMLSAHAFGGTAHGSGFHHGHSDPAITQIGSDVSYSQGGAPVVLSPGAQVSDSSSAYSGSSLTVQIPFDTSTSTNQLSIVAGNSVTLSSGSVLYNGTAIGTETGGTGGVALAVAFNSSATQAGVQAVLDQIAYSNSNPNATPSELHVAFQFTDGNGRASRPVGQDVTVLSPAAITNVGEEVTYSAGGAPVQIAPTAQVTDTANAFGGSTLNVQLGGKPSATSTDVLSLVAGNGVTLNAGQVLNNGTTVGTVTGGTAGAALAVAFSASATQADVQAVIDQVAYSNSATTLTHGHVEVAFQFTDGAGNVSRSAHQEIQFAGTNSSGGDHGGHDHGGDSGKVATATLLELGQALLAAEGVKQQNESFAFTVPGALGTSFNVSGTVQGATATETITLTLPNGDKWVETGTVNFAPTGVTETISITSPSGNVLTETGSFAMTVGTTVNLSGSVTITAPSGKALTTPVQVSIDTVNKSESLTFTTPDGKTISVTASIVTSTTGQSLQISITGSKGNSKQFQFPLPATAVF